MCTKNLKAFDFNKQPKFAWKVVYRSDNSNITSSVCFNKFAWKVGVNDATSIDSIGYRHFDAASSGLFHCFRTRFDARYYKKNTANNYLNLRIIKVKLLSQAYSGTNYKMGQFDGLPAICVRKVEWDGKFHR